MCSGLRDETAIEGSFWRWRKGSPPGHEVPVTMFTLPPTCCAHSGKTETRDNVNSDNANRMPDRRAMGSPEGFKVLRVIPRSSKVFPVRAFRNTTEVLSRLRAYRHLR